MSSDTFATDEATYGDMALKAGDVFHDDKMSYGTSTVLGFCEERPGAWYAKLARPYCYASCVGTTGPTPMLGVETYVVSVKILATCFKRVSRGMVCT